MKFERWGIDIYPNPDVKGQHFVSLGIIGSLMMTYYNADMDEIEELELKLTNIVDKLYKYRKGLKHE